MTLNTKTFMQVQTENAAKRKEMEKTTGVPVATSPCGVPMQEMTSAPAPVKQQPVKQLSLEKTDV